MNYFFFILIMFSFTNPVFPQCSHYTVEDIELPVNEPGVMRLWFMNTGDDNVYHHSWVIHTVSGDTIARFDKCLCGLVRPFNTKVSWDFETSVNSLPPLSEIRVSITNGTLVCPSVTFSELLSNQKKHESIQVSVYPNPASEKVHIQIGHQLIGSLTQIRLVNSAGTTIAEYHIKETSTLEVGHLSNGIYHLMFIRKDGSSWTEELVVIN